MICARSLNEWTDSIITQHCNVCVSMAFRFEINDTVPTSFSSMHSYFNSWIQFVAVFWCCSACVLYNSPPINKIVDSLIDGQMIISSIIRWNGHSTHIHTTLYTQIEMKKKLKRNKRIRKLGQFQFDRILFLLFNDLSRKLSLYNRNDIVDYIDCLFWQMN